MLNTNVFVVLRRLTFCRMHPCTGGAQHPQRQLHATQQLLVSHWFQTAQPRYSSHRLGLSLTVVGVTKTCKMTILDMWHSNHSKNIVPQVMVLATQQ